MLAPESLLKISWVTVYKPFVRSHIDNGIIKYNLADSFTFLHCIDNELFPSMFSSVNVSKSPRNYKLGHIY